MKAENERMQKAQVEMGRVVKELESNLQITNNRFSGLQIEYKQSQ